MSSPNESESIRVPSNLPHGSESHTETTPIAVESNQTPSTIGDDVVEVVSREGEGAKTSETLDKDDTSKRRSKVWKHFKTKRVMGKMKAECLYCHKILGGESKNGTSHLQKHFDICPLRKTRDIRQSILNTTRGGDGKTHVGVYTFDQEAARTSLGKMIILHEYPLSIVDHYGFKGFCNTLQPLFKVVSRNTIKADILKIYEHEKELFESNPSRFSITTDMWTSSNKKRGFMAVTAHFIDDSWTLQSRIMR